METYWTHWTDWMAWEPHELRHPTLPHSLHHSTHQDPEQSVPLPCHRSSIREALISVSLMRLEMCDDVSSVLKLLLMSRMCVFVVVGRRGRRGRCRLYSSRHLTVSDMLPDEAISMDNVRVHDRSLCGNGSKADSGRTHDVYSTTGEPPDGVGSYASSNSSLGTLVTPPIASRS